MYVFVLAIPGASLVLHLTYFAPETDSSPAALVRPAMMSPAKGLHYDDHTKAGTGCCFSPGRENWWTTGSGSIGDVVGSTTATESCRSRDEGSTTIGLSGQLLSLPLVGPGTTAPALHEVQFVYGSSGTYRLRKRQLLPTTNRVIRYPRQHVTQSAVARRVSVLATNIVFSVKSPLRSAMRGNMLIPATAGIHTQPTRWRIWRGKRLRLVIVVIIPAILHSPSTKSLRDYRIYASSFDTKYCCAVPPPPRILMCTSPEMITRNLQAPAGKQRGHKQTDAVVAAVVELPPCFKPKASGDAAGLQHAAQSLVV